MTTNQHHALNLARALLQKRVIADTLPENDWELLLLAAGLNYCGATARKVSRRVLANARRHLGYFSSHHRAHSRPLAGLLLPSPV
jgi:hypothetical protein